MKKATGLFIAVFSTTLCINATSFDCHKASSSIEKAICTDRYLSELDGKMGKLYHQAKQYQHDLPKYQKEWIHNRNQTCGADQDCLYTWTENRIINFKNIIADAKAGKRVNAPKKSHKKNGNVYFPERGILCDKKAGFCADREGISMGYTKEYLGQAAQDRMMQFVERDHMETASYTLSNGIYCDSHIQKCYTNKYKEHIDHTYTNKLFK